MNSRNQVNLCCQRSDLIDGTSIRTLMVFQDHFSYGLFLVLIYSFTQLCKPFFIVGKCLFQLLSNDTDIFFSCLLVVCKYSFFHLCRSNDFLDGIK